MLNIRKQLQLISTLSQTILQYRLESSEGLLELLKEIRKKIRHMIQTQIYQEGIMEMLVSKQSFQIKNKMIKLIKDGDSKKQIIIYVQIKIIAIEKCSCQMYNQQLWQFGIKIGNDKKNKKFKTTNGIIQFIEHTLRSLQCLNVLPHIKQQKNRFILDHKVIVAQTESSSSFGQFENLSHQEIVISREDEEPTKRLTSKYFYNHKKIQQNIKEIILSKSLQNSRQSKKYSIDSTEASRRLSLYQFYDDELDITVLSSNSSFQDEQDEEQFPEILHFEQLEFQILMEETANEDQLFLKSNVDLFDGLSSLQNDYI